MQDREFDTGYDTKRSELLDGIARIDAAIFTLSGEPGRLSASAKATKGPRTRRKMSEHERKAASERMRNYWAGRWQQAEARASGTAGNEAGEANAG